MHRRYDIVRVRTHPCDLLPVHCIGRRPCVFLTPNTTPLLEIILLAPVTLLAFSFLDSFVGVRCESAYPKRWTIVTRNDRVQDLERGVLSLPIHLPHTAMYVDLDRQRGIERGVDNSERKGCASDPRSRSEELVR